VPPLILELKNAIGVGLHRPSQITFYGMTGGPERWLKFPRKAAARRLAEAGCATHEIASITGHKTLSEIERYTREAERARLARTASGMVVQAFGEKSEE